MSEHLRVAREAEEHLLHLLGEDEVRVLEQRQVGVVLARGVGGERDAVDLAEQRRVVVVLALADALAAAERAEPHARAQRHRHAAPRVLREQRREAVAQDAEAHRLALLGEPAAQFVVEAALPLAERELAEARLQRGARRRRELDGDEAPPADRRRLARVVRVAQLGDELEQLLAVDERPLRRARRVPRRRLDGVRRRLVDAVAAHAHRRRARLLAVLPHRAALVHLPLAEEGGDDVEPLGARLGRWERRVGRALC